MASITEDFITEDVTNLAGEKISEFFGDEWELNSFDFEDVEIQSEMTIEIIIDDEVVGEVTIENSPMIGEDTVGTEFLVWEFDRILNIKKGGVMVYNSEYTTLDKQKLNDEVIRQIKDDLFGDGTIEALEELLSFIPIENKLNYLNEDIQKKLLDK